MLYDVIVRDTYLRQVVEDITVFTETEAKQWVKEFREGWPRECGYSVKIVKRDR